MKHLRKDLQLLIERFTLDCQDTMSNIKQGHLFTDVDVFVNMQRFITGII